MEGHTGVVFVWEMFVYGSYLPLCLTYVYGVFTGPWFLGELLEGHPGVVFVWGMFVYGIYLPLCLTYVNGVLQVLGS